MPFQPTMSWAGSFGIEGCESVTGFCADARVIAVLVSHDVVETRSGSIRSGSSSNGRRTTCLLRTMTFLYFIVFRPAAYECPRPKTLEPMTATLPNAER